MLGVDWDDAVSLEACGYGVPRKAFTNHEGYTGNNILRDYSGQKTKLRPNQAEDRIYLKGYLIFEVNRFLTATLSDFIHHSFDCLQQISRQHDRFSIIRLRQQTHSFNVFFTQ